MCDCKNNNTSCNTCQEKRCSPKPLCDCPAGYMSSDCINNVTANFECTLIESGLTLTETLEQMDLAICEIVNSIGAGSNVIVNVGAGSQLYKGIDLLGRKEIKSLTKVGDLITITPNTDDVGIGIDEEALIQLITDNSTGGYFTGNNLGFGAKVYKDTIAFTHNFRTLTSKTLSIVESPNGEEIEINISESAQIPAIYFNNLFIPSYEDWLSENTKQNVIPVIGFEYKGNGTLSKPFTDTTVYPLGGGVRTIVANTAIQNALDYYVGDLGTYSKSNPQRIGERIIGLNNSGQHIFEGNFNYKGLHLINEGYILSTTSGFLLDMEDSAFSTNSEIVKIESRPQSVLEVRGEGFRNNGNSESTTNYLTGKEVQLLGEEGTIYSANTDVTKNIINASVSNIMNNNDGQLCFKIYTRIVADYQNVYRVGGKARVDFYGTLVSGTLTTTVVPSLKAFHQTGGEVRMFKTAQVTIYGGVRTDGFTFEPLVGRPTNFIATGTVFSGQCVNLFTRILTSSGDALFNVTNSPSGYGLAVNEVFNSSKNWFVGFNQNTIAYGNINSGLADLTKGNTVGAINIINGQVIETLRKYTSKEEARIALVTEKSAYIVERTISSSEFIVGVEYIVKVSGEPSIGQSGSYVIATEAMKTSSGAQGLLHERCTMT